MIRNRSLQVWNGIIFNFEREKFWILILRFKIWKKEDMYFSLGHHPGFIFNKDSQIVLKQEEFLTDNFEKGLVSSLEKNIEINKIDFNNLDFSDGKSYMTNSFTKQDIVFNSSDYNFKVSTKDFNDLVFWRESNDCNFICIENWNGIPDLLIKNSSELKDKAGIMSLKENEERDFLLEIKF